MRAADHIRPVICRLLLFLTAAAPLACTFEETPAALSVSSASGNWSGLQADGVVSFKGIPYAAPVDGDRRWAPPVAASTLSGGFVAKDFGAPCAHLNELFPDKRTPADFVGAPDCLNLNIWVPEETFAKRQTENIPVMVFIHGGSFEIGFSGWNPGGIRIYEGARLAKAGAVIVVTINYRVGTLGFLKHPAINVAAGGRANLGILDQIEALRWVQKNISAFGGDPANVTVFGESAGAVSICNLLTTGDAKGLFHKAIMQSGTCLLQTAAKADATAAQLSGSVGCGAMGSIEEQAACLRAKSDKEIVVGQPMATTLFRGEFTGLQIAPVLDGVTFGEIPDSVIKRGEHHQMPILIGTNAREIPAWMQVESKDAWENHISALSARVSPDVAEQIRKLYEERNRGGYKDLISELKTDISFTCRARYFADLFAKNQTPPVYLYLFEKNLDLIESFTDRVHGSFHGMELFYVFQHVPAWSWPGLHSVLSSHQDLQRQMRELWTTFAKSGTLPTDETWQDWRPYREKRIAGIIGDFSGTLDDPRKDKCELIERYLLADGAAGVLQ